MTLRLIALAFLSALVALGVPPPRSHAGVLVNPYDSRGGWIIRGGPEVNHVRVAYEPETSELVVSDSRSTVTASDSQCSARSPSTVACSSPAQSPVLRVLLDDGDDRARVDESVVTQPSVLGGKGDDYLSVRGLRIRADLYGQRGHDVLVGGRRGDTLAGDFGADRMRGGDGADNLSADGYGVDEVIDCGLGRDDEVFIDRADRQRVERCERIFVVPCTPQEGDDDPFPCFDRESSATLRPRPSG